MNDIAPLPAETKKNKSGCIVKGCLITFGAIIVLPIVLSIGGYLAVKDALVSSKPIDLPIITDIPEQQRLLTDRWKEFAKASRENKAAKLKQPLRIQFNAEELNQLIAANRKARGKGYLKIEGNKGLLQVSIPLNRIPFRGKFFNALAEANSPPDRNPLKLRINKLIVNGGDAPESALNAIFNGGSLSAYLKEYIEDYGVTGFSIENGSVILESGTD